MFIMYFYRFYRANKRQIGCIKAFGFRDSSLRLCFILFVALLSTAGALLGLMGGYFLSDLLIQANTDTYSVTGLVKGISKISILVGMIVSTGVFCLTAFCSYSFVGGKEPGVLIMGNGNNVKNTISWKAANYISGILPVKDKFPLRIALRKPLSIFLILIAVMSFNICIILGQSLNTSSQKISESQRTGHNYDYDTKYSEYQTKIKGEEGVFYLDHPAIIFTDSYEIEQTVTSLYTWKDLFQLENAKGDILTEPVEGKVYINPYLSETYNLGIGDVLLAEIEGNPYEFMIADIAVNAKTSNIYINSSELTKILAIPKDSYNGVLSNKEETGVVVTTKDQKRALLDRQAVSNKTSAVINQSTGVLVGIILIFLALYLNFQDNTHDMLILHMMGYQTKQIRKILVDVYMPIVWTAFFITLIPSILVAKSIQKSFSISTKDYMPFGINGIVIVVAFLFLCMIYYLVQTLFGLGIKKIIAKEKVLEVIYPE
ncbi:MAG: ABC transporter permease [Clostridiales bacterium]|nr:ABC transporter permease [Clostridiales bacterium]